jgi:hydrogenase maturation protein HypF
MAGTKSKQVISDQITVIGVVQGVGFRPFVARLAAARGWKGYVKNCGGYVEIVVQASKSDAAPLPKEALRAFLHDLSFCSGAQIVSASHACISATAYPEFFIAESTESEQQAVVLPADLPVCERCLQEMKAETNRRYGHGFISCVDCGPRYSIIEEIPYDRPTTTMGDFPMCRQCEREYYESEDRRYYAQTICCHECGPVLRYRDKEGKEQTGEQALSAAIGALERNQIVAVKGIGGYHLACTPFCSKTVQRLRQLKGREEKPFAVMFRDLSLVREYCELSGEEESLLCSPARPIVLLKAKGRSLCPEVSCGSLDLGVFLPYTPYQHQILESCGVLIMTSANLSDQPILREDQDISFDLCDGILYHYRRIAVSLDDSVACLSDGEPLMIRRGRGYVPLPLYLPRRNRQPQAFAAGGDLKAVFGLQKEGFFYLSQPFGDLKSRKNSEVYRENVKRMERLFQVRPEYAVCDLHPLYYSAAYAETLDVPLIRLQHHYTHILSVMAEHQLQEPVLGIAFDGTGYGTDGTVWGGEFLLCREDGFSRLGALQKTPVIGSDESMKDAAKTAVCMLLAAGQGNEMQDARYSILKRALKQNINTVASSSMGRLFDGVSALLGVCGYNRYEGEAAIRLEQLARTALLGKKDPLPLAFSIEETDGMLQLGTSALWSGLLEGRQDPARAALGFHWALAAACRDMALVLAERTGVWQAALSGGVFQNRLLLHRTRQLLTEAGFQVYTNHQVPPGDGGLALGQLYYCNQNH